MTKFDTVYYHQHTNHYLTKDLFQIPSFVWIKKELGVKKGEKVLDAGCGTGYLLDFLCGKRVKGVGVDISWEALKTAKKLFPWFEFIQADLTKLPFKNGNFDKIFCFNVIEHIKDQDKAMREFQRVLKPRGVIVFGTNIKDSLSWQLFKLFCGGDSTHTREFNAQEFLSFVGQYFKVVKSTRSSCIARFWSPVSWVLNRLLKGDILVKAIKQ